MNAINFIQQHGVEKAREVVEGAPERVACLDLTPAPAFDLETLRDCDTSPNCKKFDEQVK